MKKTTGFDSRAYRHFEGNTKWERHIWFEMNKSRVNAVPESQDWDCEISTTHAALSA